MQHVDELYVRPLHTITPDMIILGERLELRQHLVKCYVNLHQGMFAITVKKMRKTKEKLYFKLLIVK